MIRKFAAILLMFIMFVSVCVLPASANNTIGNNCFEINILTSTLGEPIGMQGFVGDYVITDFNEQVEIYVQFATPPAVALRLMQERGISHNLPRGRLADSFEQQALSAHDVFQQQLAQIPMPRSLSSEIEIIDEHYSLFNGVLMSVPGNMVEMIAELPEVYGVFPNAMFHVLPYEQVAYEYYAYEVNVYVENIYATTESFVVNSEFMLEVRELFDTDYIHNEMGITGAGVRVAVLDTGIQHDHPEFVRFQDETGRIRGWQRGNNSISTNTSLRHGIRAHGTAVSGSIVAVAPGVELWNYRVNISGVGGLSTLAAVEAAHADRMDIMNLSFGEMFSFGPFTSHRPMFSAVNLAVLDGIIVVVSAGNDGWLGMFSVSAPATSSLVISVGAGTSGGRGETLDALASFSSRGPLEETFHIKPNIVAPGVQVYTTDIYSRYRPVDGTSFSAPVIAAVAALLLEQSPDATPFEIKARIMNTARPLEILEYNNPFFVGAGFVDPLAALLSETLVTTEYYVPLTAIREDPWELQTMASLSFGHANPDEQAKTAAIPITIANNGDVAKTYIIDYEFTTNPHGGAGIEFSQTLITVESGETAEFTAAVTFDKYASGYIRGYVHIKIDANIIARVPFGVVTPFLSSDLLAYGQFPAADWNESGAEWVLHGDGRFVVESGLIGLCDEEFPSYFAYLRYIRRIIFTGPIVTGDSLEGLFFGMENLISITGLEHFDTSETTNMSTMFGLSPSLISVDLSSWDVSNVTTMEWMFSFAENLTSVYVSGWDTGNVIDMNSMFLFANSLEYLDVSGWDTGNVTDMGNMFWGARNLTKLDVSNWNISNVTTMFSMFSDTGLTSLDLSNWDVRNVQDFGAIFANSTELASLDMSNWEVCIDSRWTDAFARNYSLRKMTLSESFHRSALSGLSAVPDNYRFTGYWQNVGTGTVENPQGEFEFKSSGLMTSFDGKTMEDTWVWQPVNRSPMPPNLSIHNNYIIRNIDITDNGISFSITNLNNARQKLHFIAAKYDDDGVLQQVEVIRIRVPQNFSVRRIRIPEWFDINDENSKIMLWEAGTIAPIIMPVSSEL
ncbi:MAG: S8 family serine peptidase [Oscillospiraceae bacterium]|nr:S8 family serine peptidase [Oscillospiraceae bacterium]